MHYKKKLKIPSSYFHKKESETEKLDKSKTVNEKIISDMRYEIENLKKEKQVQSNLIKLQKEEVYKKKQTIEQYEKENSNHKLALKKQEIVIKTTTDKGNK